jgi:hypothetical protein
MVTKWTLWRVKNGWIAVADSDHLYEIEASQYLVFYTLEQFVGHLRVEKAAQQPKLKAVK